MLDDQIELFRAVDRPAKHRKQEGALLSEPKPTCIQVQAAGQTQEPVQFKAIHLLCLSARKRQIVLNCFAVDLIDAELVVLVVVRFQPR